MQNTAKLTKKKKTEQKRYLNASGSIKCGNKKEVKTEEISQFKDTIRMKKLFKYFVERNGNNNNNKIMTKELIL